MKHPHRFPYLASLLILAAVQFLIFPAGIAAQQSPQSTASPQPAAREDALEAFRQGRYQDAIRITTAEIASRPGNMDSYVVQGWAYLALGRWADAADLAQRAMQLARYDHRVLAIMGEAQFRLGNYLAALPYLQDYASVRPGGAVIHDIYRLMGEIHMQFEEYHSADIAFTTSLYYQPADAQLWARLGFAREQAGSTALALQAYERALEISPNLQAAQEAINRLNS